jgi:hypothetical protein
MAKELLLRRGTTAENNLFVGALAEPSYDTERKELRVHDGSTVGGKVVSMATGMVAAFAGTTAPEGWLVCDGSIVSRTDYADLFAQIGSTYGDGDGSTTFNLPDLSDCFVQGGTPGTSHIAGLPNITGSSYGYVSSANRGASGALQMSGGSGKDATSGGGWWVEGVTVSIDASRSSSVYGASTTVQPKSVEMLFCIKY